MAKEDFCFTYYDGDALRDMSHMDRLERGGYNDIVLQQRKFGRMTLEQIKKVLGKDFERCWQSIELVLKTEDGKYWIEWLEISIKKMRAHAGRQSENGKKGGRKNLNESEPKPDESQTLTNQKPDLSERKPLEDGNVNEDVFELKNKKESPEKNEIFEGIFTDEIFLGELSRTNKGKNIQEAFEQCWLYHIQKPSPPVELWEWKQKFITWLSIKKADNGSPKNKSTDHVTGLMEGFQRRHGAKTRGG